VVIPSQCALGSELVFWQDEDKADDGLRDVLPLVRPG
jgi:hypothetical protein